jgi:AAA domain (Cdc48 subfamily)
LIGSPPGYLGHREAHPLLSPEPLNQHHTEKMKVSLVLFDEIEKASDSLWNLLLRILDKATLKSQSRFFQSHDLHIQQPGRGGDGRSGNAPVGILAP